MRITVAAFFIVAVGALTAASAQAQGVGGPGMGAGNGVGSFGGRKQQQSKKPKTEAKPKVDEKAYNAALKSLPDKQYDPWHGVR